MTTIREFKNIHRCRCHRPDSALEELFVMEKNGVSVSELEIENVNTHHIFHFSDKKGDFHNEANQTSECGPASRGILYFLLLYGDM
jgi:hypothetical protein